MAELSERVAVLEGRVNELSQTNRRFDMLEQQIFHIRDELRIEISDVRREMSEVRSEMQKMRNELHEEISEVRSEVSGLREEISQVRSEIYGVKDELRSEMNGIKDELRGEMNGLREELGRRIDKYFGWLVVIIIALCVNLAGVSYQIFLQFVK